MWREHHVVPTFRLRIGPVLDLQPAVPTVLVGAQLALRHDAFEIAPANLLEEFLAAALDVLSVKESLATRHFDQPVQSLLPLEQWSLPQVFVIEPQEIEGVQNW